MLPRPFRSIYPAASADAIAPLASDPEYACQTAILNALRTKRREIDRRLDRLQLEQYFETSGGPRSGSQREQDSFDRLQAMRAETFPSNPVPPADGVPPVVARALELLRGDSISQTESFNAQRTRAEAEMRIIVIGYAAQQEIVDRIADEKLQVMTDRLAPRHREILRQGLDAFLAAAAAVDAVRQLHVDLIEAGYRPSSITLQGFPLRVNELLGTARDPSSPLSAMRRAFEADDIP